ncbi:MAG TPA: hypothetical protein VLB74_11030 [Flavobacterium sp.]|uniref:Rieske (2Fe-2S) protein n=1 Tax=Flavobacterium sp. TaxID=239 RepID=UPI002CCBCC80|nr:hypothetical protein [Flavobacterium sp.]HSD15173.1 hypothetical protein [Flavobacterium sp.]
MKRSIFLIIVTAVFIISCNKDENTINNNNPYLPNYPVNVQINMSFPAYSNLQYPSNSAYVGGYGVRGIIIFNTGSGYYAFDAACPNQALSSCSTMTIDGINAVCACDEKEYNLFTGLANGAQYPMKQYRTSVSGSVINVYN